MKMNKLVLLSSVMLALAFAGAAQDAPTGAQIESSGSNNTATTSGTGNVTIQAGRTVNVDLDQSSLTEKWAGFFGTITGSTVLGDGSDNLYTWTASQFADAKVIATPQSIDAPTSVSPVDNPNTFLNGYDDDADFDTGIANASTTFSLDKATDPLGSGSDTSNTAAVNTYNSSGSADDRFTTYLYSDGSSNPVYVAEGTSETSESFNGDSVNYQMLVGVGQESDGTAGTETFSFYLELP